MDELQRQIWEVLINLDSEQIACAFTNYYGNQLLSENFAEFLIEEGYAYSTELPALDDDYDDDDCDDDDCDEE